MILAKNTTLRVLHLMRKNHYILDPIIIHPFVHCKHQSRSKADNEESRKFQIHQQD